MRLRLADRSHTLMVGAVACAVTLLWGCSGLGQQTSGPTGTPVPPPSFDASAMLPDLQMVRLKSFFTARPPNKPDSLELRFTAEFVNTGAGAFEAHGQRPGASTSIMSVSQVVYRKDGSTIEFPTSATMAFKGDDHDHWHIQNLESYDVDELATNKRVVSSLKSGFCLWDNAKYDTSLPGAAPEAKYYDCGAAVDRSVSMGVSVGWGDEYHWTLTNQYVEIGGVKPGSYRLYATVNASRWFAESDYTNNVTWVDLEFSTGPKETLAVEVTGYGPSAPEPTP